MKIFKDIFKSNTSSSFKVKPIENSTAADYFKMIENGELPTFVSTKDKERIIELNSKGHQWDAVRRLQAIVEKHNGGGKQNKSFA